MSLLRILLRFVMGLVGVCILLVGVAVVRLAAGPLDVSFLTPYLETAMTDAPVRLEIDGTSLVWDGFGAPIELLARNVRVSDAATGAELADIPAMAVTVNVPELFAGQISPSSLTLTEPIVRVQREADGSFGLELAGMQFNTPSNRSGGEDRADAEGSTSALGGLLQMLRSDNPLLSGFTSLRIEDALVFVDDRAMGLVWTAPSTNIELRRDPDGIAGMISLAADIGEIEIALDFDGRLIDEGDSASISGQVSLDVTQAGREATYDGSVSYRSGGPGEIELIGSLVGRLTPTSPELRASIIVDQTLSPMGSLVRYSIDEVVPADWATAAPVLSPLSSLTSPVTANGVLELNDRFLPQRIEMHMRAGAGQLNLPTYYPEPLNVASMQLTAIADFPSRRFSLPQFTVDLGGPQIVAEANIQIEPIGLLDAVGTITLTDMPVDLLSTYWPEAITPARSWITNQISRGVIRTASLNMHTRLFNLPGQPVELVSLSGEMDLEDMTVEYLSGMDSVSGASGSAVFDQREFIITLDSGTVQGVDVLAAVIAIRNLDRPPAEIDVTLALAGPVTNAMEVINAPRLRLADRSGLNPTLIGGDMAGRLAFAFPLGGPDQDVVAYGGVFDIRDGSADGLFDTLTLSGLEGQVRVDGEGFSLTGTGALNGLSADILVSQSYEPDGDGNLRSEVTTTLPDGRYDLLGFPDVPGLSGPLPVRVDVTVQPGGSYRLNAGLDLTAARLEVEPLRFTKPPGIPGRGQVSATLQNGRLLGDVAFSVDAQGLAVDGRVAVDDSGTVSFLDVPSLDYDGTDVAVQAAFNPSGAMSIDIAGRQLNISRLIGNTGLFDLGLEQGSSDDPPRNISVEVGRLILGQGRGLNDVVANVASAGGSVSQLTISATHDGGGTVSVNLLPIEGGDLVSLRSANAGALIALAGESGRISGGQLALDARIVGGSGSGALVVEDFRVREAPELARIMAAEPVSAQMDPLDVGSIRFDRLETQLSFAGNRLTVRDGRASGGQLGITFDGVADFANDTIDFSGTFVPLYGLNSLLSGVPLIGDLLYGGVGGGVFAFTYRVSGATDAPSVSVNPLSVLAPGILRRIFFEGVPPA
ncbi:MAG: DUF3971 domain-containing protein [Pseudomonadota bacterium]